jgi:hypothetical protein
LVRSEIMFRAGDAEHHPAVFEALVAARFEHKQHRTILTAIP